MSTVKIKTEPTAAEVAVKVKLEPSLSTDDIKLEQHTSDIDTKVESNSEVDIKSDDDSDNGDTDQATEAPKKQRQLICEHPGCGRSFKYTSSLTMHRHDHRLQTELNRYGKTYILTRQSLDDRWPCPIPDCTSTCKTVHTWCTHVRKTHAETTKQQQNRQPLQRIARNSIYFLDVDNFYVNGVRCGYHNNIKVFICHDCRLVPECLLTHLQQKHGYDEKSIDNSVLPESAVIVNADPSINQHTNNPHLAAAISQPYLHYHQDIVQGWLCAASGCGYCGCSATRKSEHRKTIHQGQQLTTVPALLLRLLYGKVQTSYFLITRIDQASSTVTTSSNRIYRHKLDYSHNGLSDQDENEDDANQSVTTDTFSQKRNYICDYPNCGQFFNSSSQLSEHRREHKLEVMITVRGAPFILSRHSLDDRWTCPISDCETTRKSVATVKVHIRDAHSTLIRQKRASMKDDEDQQHPVIKKAKITFRYFDVDNFYVNGARCGYHTTTGVFICYECRLVPECLLSHLQQKHGFDEKSIDNSALPESAVNANVDTNINQHASNSHLVSVISQPYQQQLHQDIVQGWLCVTSNCGYCGFTAGNKKDHKKRMHQGEQLATIPALVLRLEYAKIYTSCFLITRLDQVTTSSNRMNRHRLDYSHNELNAQDENEDDTGQNETTETFNLKRQWKCERSNCGRLFSSSNLLSKHRLEHKIEAVISVKGRIYNLTRQSLDDRWICPVPQCETRCKTVDAIRHHIQKIHRISMKQKRANIEDNDSQRQHLAIKKRPPTIYYLKVEDFYLAGTRCGYHSMTGVFICYECRLVPDCLLTHLRQKHGYDEKSIENYVLPESARGNGDDPSINQHTGNPHLAAAIEQPNKQRHRDIIRGWLCVTSNCGHCCCTQESRYQHRSTEHRGEQQSTAPALVLRLLYGTAQTSGFLITRLDTVTSNVNTSKLMTRHNSKCDEEEDDGDELVLSDYSDEDDIH